MIQKPRGTRDLLPEDMSNRRFVEEIMTRTSINHGFGEVRTPMFEELELFTMKSGDDVVEEIYDFEDKGGRRLALRPELTAAVIRLFANEMQERPKPQKVFYFGECFRYERPQKGRYREFRQYGAEIIGGDRVATNVEIIDLALAILSQIGLGDLKVRIGYLDLLRTIFLDAGVEVEDQGAFMRLIDKQDFEGLDTQLEVRELPKEVKEDVKRVSDFKKDAREGLDELEDLEKDLSNSHDIGEHISDYRAIMEGVLSTGIVDEKGISMDLGIARGLDYYTGMVFEVDYPRLGAEKQVCGGGAYALTELFGLEAMNTTGFAMGVDRIVMALEKENGIQGNRAGPMVYVIPFEGTEEKAREIVGALRSTGTPTDHDLASRSLSKNLKYASSRGARYTILVGERELEKDVVTVRDMITGEQEEIPLDGIVDHFKAINEG